MSEKIFEQYKDFTSMLFTALVLAIIAASITEGVSIKELLLTILNK